MHHIPSQRFILFQNYVYACLYLYTSLCPVEARRGHPILWSWNCFWFWAINYGCWELKCHQACWQGPYPLVSELFCAAFQRWVKKAAMRAAALLVLRRKSRRISLKLPWTTVSQRITERKESEFKGLCPPMECVVTSSRNRSQTHGFKMCTWVQLVNLILDLHRQWPKCFLELCPLTLCRKHSAWWPCLAAALAV